jgi:hypothetical protein
MAVQRPERKPKPMTNCQMNRWDFFARIIHLRLKQD